MIPFQDTADVAFNFQHESPIRKGIYSVPDMHLQQRCLAQVMPINNIAIFVRVLPTGSSIGMGNVYR